MWIGEAHPAEPVVVGAERVEPRDGAIGNPIGVVPLRRDGVVVYLRRPGLSTAGSVDLQRHVEYRFTDITSKAAPELNNIGMVTDAVFTDIDNDRKSDLVLVGEWMTIRVLKNNGYCF